MLMKVSSMLLLLSIACGKPPPAGRDQNLPDGGVSPDPTGGRGDNNPPLPATRSCLSEDARFLLTGIAAATVGGLKYMTEHALPLERPYFLSPIGAQPHLGSATLNAPCSAPETARQSCLSEQDHEHEGALEFLRTRDACIRLRCEAANIGLVDLYFTMKPSTSFDDARAFTYPTAAPFPAATVHEQPGPRITWRMDLRDPNHTQVTAEVQRAAHVSLQTGSTLDFSHTGVLKGVRNSATSSGETGVRSGDRSLRNGARHLPGEDRY